MNNFKNLSIAIVTHVYATGPSFKLEEYLRNKVENLVFIGHPFSFAKDTRSFIRVYRKGDLVIEKKFIKMKRSEFLFYAKDFLLTIYWCLKYSKNTQYFFGVNNFNSFSGYILKKFGKVQDVIFYTIDYVPNRFDSKIMNYIYHWLDRFVISKSLKVWNLSSQMADEREKRGVNTKFRSKQIVVPIGTEINAPPMEFNKIDKNKIVFMGHLREGQGVEMLVSSMKDVIRKIPEAHLLIIGGGPLENKIRLKINKLRLEKSIKLSGFVEKFSEVRYLLKNAAVAVAPYVDDEKTYPRYTDPGKPKDYLSCGLPVIITKVPQFAFVIDEKRCGIAISYDQNELSEAIIKLSSNKNLLKEYRTNAFELAKKYTWEKIFNKAFQNTL